MSEPQAMAPKSEIFGWAMFDFANSSYATVILTVVYAQMFPKLIVGDDERGNLLWSVAFSVSYAMTVVTAPLFGAIIDYVGRKKQFLLASTLTTVLLTSSLYFVDPGEVGLCMAILVLSNFGYSAGESFSSAFLPDLGPSDALGKISGFAWGLGYLGGLVCTATIIFGLGPVEPNNIANLAYVGPITGAFFGLASIPTFVFLKDRTVPKPIPPGQNVVSVGFGQLRKTIGEIWLFRDLAVFLGSMFFSQAGLSIVIAFAFIYGDQVLHWEPTTMIAMFVITQITAAGGAVVFGLIQDRLGAKPTYGLTLLLWIVASVMIYGTPMITVGINSAFGLELSAATVFLGVGSLAGSGIGATQSAGRALVGMFSPGSKAGEFFGFWGLMGKLAAIFGMLGTGVLQTVVGLQQAILFCAVLFFVALIVVWFVDEGRGRSLAATYGKEP